MSKQGGAGHKIGSSQSKLSQRSSGTGTSTGSSRTGEFQKLVFYISSFSQLINKVPTSVLISVKSIYCRKWSNSSIFLL